MKEKRVTWYFVNSTHFKYLQNGNSNVVNTRAVIEAEDAETLANSLRDFILQLGCKDLKDILDIKVTRGGD